MKQMCSFLLALLLCGALAACGTEKPSAENPVDVDTMDVQSLYNQETKKSVSLGMTKAEVEARLGKGVEQKLLLPNMETFYEGNTDFPGSDVRYVSYGTGEDFLVLTYYKDQAVALSSFGNFEGVQPGPSHWCVKYGINYGSSLQSIMEKYGQTEPYSLAPSPELAQPGQGFLDTPNVIWKDPVTINYLFDKDGKPLENGANENGMYRLHFFVDNAQDGLMWYALELVQ